MEDIERQELLDSLASMIEADFGPPNQSGEFEPMCAHCQANHALRVIQGLYKDLELDEIADRVISGRTN